MIKNYLIFGLILSVIGFWARPARAVSSQVGAAEDLGVGIALGQPIGVTAKYWLSSSLAVDGAAGYHWNSNFDMHADYLWHSFSSFHLSSGRLPFYLGLGGRVLLGDDSQFGARFPLGASFLLPHDPIEFFAELAPVVKLTSGLGLDIDGLLGVRLYINYMK
ncbi:MAG: hypothetical protein A2992_03405 [Elusimicrobia bacterium RIFCSPLOWO2_01_FULL_59_12]|nr:MAG: hypothetical protein A2992_03405 [Elusimicrobia bacterium RIFCSPLOWO2_01_FULL_59_12]